MMIKAVTSDPTGEKADWVADVERLCTNQHPAHADRWIEFGRPNPDVRWTATVYLRDGSFIGLHCHDPQTEIYLLNDDGDTISVLLRAESPAPA